MQISDPSGQFPSSQVEFVGGSNVTLTRAGDQITISSSFVNTNTITTLETSGGSPVSGTLISLAQAVPQLHRTQALLTSVLLIQHTLLELVSI
ncbi:MAG: hypothetical protein CM15mV4_1400 [Caudoviricetes sp.]|nr:MAG: hypothetical protein CM15mV4_1400 [Caudoviricetes sp.]